jgi:hypothetical protein
MRLLRTDYLATGIFGLLLSENTAYSWYTLEHAYDDGQGGFKPKVPGGVYTCQRGSHQLLGMAFPFETFEITNVPGHTNILFHVGNTNSDSAGCVLLGAARQADIGILESRVAFQMFLDTLEGVASFDLTIDDKL